MTDLDKMARELLARRLDDWGHPQEAQSVREGEDLKYYEGELVLIRDALLNAPPGYVLVPAEPTGEMLRAALRAPCNGHPETGCQSHRGIYRAMLAAAPEPKA